MTFPCYHGGSSGKQKNHLPVKRFSTLKKCDLDSIRHVKLKISNGTAIIFVYGTSISTNHISYSLYFFHSTAT